MEVFWNAEKQVRRWYKGVSPQVKVSFATVFIVGLAAHIRVLTELLFNHDQSLTGSADWMVVQGKWLSGFIYDLDAGSYATSFDIVTSLFALALCAAMLTDALGIKSKVWSLCIGGTVVTFPSVMSTFSYHCSFWNAFLAILAFWLIQKLPDWRGWVLGTVSLVLALGVYPPYIGLTASCLLYYCCAEVLRPESDVKSIVKRGLSSLCALGVGIGGYYAVLQIRLKQLNAATYNYLNVDTMAEIHWLDLPRLAAEAYKQVFNFFWYDAAGTGAPVFVRSYRAVILLLVVGLLYLAWERKVFTSPVKIFFLAVFAGLFPLSVDLVYVFSKGATVHWIMMYTFVMLFVMVFKLADDCQQIFVQKNGMSALKSIFAGIQQWGSLALAVVLLYSWTVLSNEGYLRMRMAFYGAYANLTNIADEIYECPGYTPESPIALIGSDQRPVTDLFPQFDNFAGIQSRHFIFSYDGTLTRFMELILQTNFVYADAATVEQIMQTEAFAEMPLYPQDGYVQEIDGVIVAKFSK